MQQELEISVDPTLQSLEDTWDIVEFEPEQHASEPPVLRPYQIAAVEVLLTPPPNIWRQLVVIATGGGKTLVIADLIKRSITEGKRALVLAHRDELISQAEDKIQWYYPGVQVEREKAGDKASRNKPQSADSPCVVVASVQSLHAKRLAEYDPHSFDLIICDETHHATSDSYKNIFTYFGCFDDTIRTPLVGVTATPDRSDRKNLSELFQREAYRKDIAALIREGYLCDVRAKRVNSDTDLSDISIVQGDFDQKALSEAVDSAERNALIVQSYLKYAPGQKAVVFAASVAHAQRLAEVFKENGIPSESIWGALDKPTRKQRLRDFHDGNIQVLVNCMILCLDDKTEILTRYGWKNIDTISSHDLVANFNSEDHSIFFEKSLDIVQRMREADEKMVSLSTTMTNFRVVDGHNMLHRYPIGKNWIKKTAGEIVGKGGFLPVSGYAKAEHITLPEKIEKSSAEIKRLISAQSYNLRSKNGFSWENSIDEAKRRLNVRENLTYTKPEDLSLDECFFIGFWLGDGSTAKLQSGGTEHTISQSLRYYKTVNLLDELIVKLGYDVVRKERPTCMPQIIKSGKKEQSPYNHIRWSFSRGTGGGCQERKGLYSIEPYLDKSGSDLLWGLNEKQFESLIHGLWLADGSHGQFLKPLKDSYFGIATGNKNLCDILQSIGTCRGLRSRYSEVLPRHKKHKIQYIMSFTKSLVHTMPTGSQYPTGSPSYEDNWKQERVWCVTTSSGNIVTRRNGKVVIMGNCEGYDEPAISCIILARPTKSPTLLLQIIGRGTRLYEGKKFLLVLDIQDKDGKERALTVAGAFGLPNAFKEDDTSLSAASEMMKDIDPGLRDRCLDYDSLVAIHEKVKAGLDAEDIDILQRREAEEAVKQISELRWHRSGEGYVLHVGQQKYQLEPDSLGNLQLHWISANQHRVAPEVFTTPEKAFEHWDKFIQLRHEKDVKLIRNDEPWLTEPASDKQLFSLYGYGMFKKGVDIPAELSRAEASDLLGTCKYEEKLGARKFSYRRVPENLRYIRPPKAWAGPYAKKK